MASAPVLEHPTSPRAPSPASGADPRGEAERPALQGAALWSVLAALMLTLLLEALDQTIVGTALPRIIGSLQGFDRYIWVVTAYMLASSTLIPVVGKLSDQFGRKWFLLSGTALFLVGSALSGASQTMDELIAFRALQGLGAGIGIALVFTVIGDIFPPAQRARWQGLLGAVYGFSSVVGPSLGGLLTDHGPLLGDFVTDSTRWRWVFYINLPIGLVALAALALYMPANISHRSGTLRGWSAVRQIDFLGAILAAAASICLLLGLTWGSNAVYAWDSAQVIGVLVGAVALYAAFFVNERYAREPVLPLSLFRNSVFALSSLLSLLQGMILVALVLYLPLYLQGVQGQSASNAGAVITPLTVASVIGSIVGGFVVGRLQRYRVVSLIGSAVMVVGLFLLTRLQPASGLPFTLLAMVVTGVGLGSFWGFLQVAAQNALPRSLLGVGTGGIRYMSQIGAVLGLAVVGSVVDNTLATDMAPRLAAIPGADRIPASVLPLVTNPQVLVSDDFRNGVIQGLLQNTPPAAQQQALDTLNAVFEALRLSLASGVIAGFVVMLLFGLLMLALSAFLKDLPLSSRGGWSEGGH